MDVKKLTYEIVRDLLPEVGEGTSKGFPTIKSHDDLEVSGDSLWGTVVYNFSTPSGLYYDIVVSYDNNPKYSYKEKPYQPGDPTINSATVDFTADGGYEATNRQELFGIMSTISNVLKKEFNRPEVKGKLDTIDYIPAAGKGRDSKPGEEYKVGMAQRDKLYLAYIKKAVPVKKVEYGENNRTTIYLKETLIKESEVNFDALEKVLDEMFEDLDIDINFTKHFRERVIERGLTEEDVIELMRKIHDKYGDELADMPKDSNRVFTHLQRLVDIASVMGGYGNDYLRDLYLKTAYKRKSKDEPEFKTNKTAPKLKVAESYKGKRTNDGAPGTLKAKISKLYGGDVTIEKAKKLKNRKNATAHDKRQANWFINFHSKNESANPNQLAALEINGDKVYQFLAKVFGKQSTDVNFRTVADQDFNFKGNIPLDYFITGYAKLDHYFGEPEDNRTLGVPMLKVILKKIGKIPEDVIETAIDYFQYQQDTLNNQEWFEQGEFNGEEEHNPIAGSEFDDMQDNYEDVVDYRIDNSDYLKKRADKIVKENKIPEEDESAAPYGSGYKKLKEQEGQDRVNFYTDYYTNISPSTFNIDRQGDDIHISNILAEYPEGFDDKETRQVPVEEEMEEILMPHITSLTGHMVENGLSIDDAPEIHFVDDPSNAEQLFGRTAFYDPNEKSITLYVTNRHPKDILRSFAHEMIHYNQDCEGRLHNTYTTNVNEDDRLMELEREAYERGNMYFRSWENSLNEDDRKGIKAYSLELAKGLEENMTETKSRYNVPVKELANKIFTSWKDQYEGKEGILNYSDNEGSLTSKTGNTFHFELDANLIVKETPDKTYAVIDKTGVDPDVDPEEGDPTFLIYIQVDPRSLPKKWPDIYFDLVDIVRHEIEHLTHFGPDALDVKRLEDDKILRLLIKKGMLPNADYFRLPAEIDAMLQGMAMKARKKREPFAKTLNDYLDIQDITPEEKENILNLWRKRAPALSLPKF